MEICQGKRHQEPSANTSRNATPEPLEASSTDGNFRPVQRTPPPSRVGPPPSPPVPTSPVAPVAPEPNGPVHLTPCQVCGRTFGPQSLSKHVKICEKMAAKKRKTFDSSRQRREGTDLEQFLPKNFGLPENSPFLEKSPPNTAKTLPKTKPQSVRSAITKPMAELQRCPHCNRAFGNRAYERHVEWCADKAKILPAAPAQPPPHIANAKQRLNARTQYKAPLARGRRSSQTRDKSSNSRSTSVDSSRGVSPPPQPREYGDYRHGRTRASESMSSNDQDDAPTAHVPVIRNSRSSLNNSSGDAHVKARQARLARDLSSSRIDDTYDPFLSAAGQMKELMSSESNISKKTTLSTKDHNRTLPLLRNSKDKASITRQENTKTMKDTLNRTYQKTPTLQRMKSFGSTTSDTNNTFGGRCSSFRINRSDKKPSQKLNTTFTKSSKENISTLDKNTFNRNSALNRSFSSYTTSNYSTPKLKDKIPKVATSMYHSFQRSTIKHPAKLDKMQTSCDNKAFVNLDSILAHDNASMTDSNYIDPRLINENDNLPINVNTILNNPDIISSMESLLNTENLPKKFDSFNAHNKQNMFTSSETKTHDTESTKIIKDTNGVNEITAPTFDDLTVEYDKIMSSLEQSMVSKNTVRDNDSFSGEFDLEEFMTTFDDEINKRKNEPQRICSSTTRIVKQSELLDSNRNSELNSSCSTPKIVHSCSNGSIPSYNKSLSLNFSNNISNEGLFPSSFKRSTSLLDSIQKKNTTINKVESGAKSRHKADQLEEDIMQSLKEFDRFYEAENQSNKSVNNYNMQGHSRNGTAKRESQVKTEKKIKKQNGEATNGKYTPNGKISSDSAYSSLNRISPSKLSVCNSKESNGVHSLEKISGGSDSGGSHRDNDIRSVSSEEFLAMERSAEINDLTTQLQDGKKFIKEIDNHNVAEKRASSRASSHQSPTTWRSRASVHSSSSSESLHKSRNTLAGSMPRLSRFCHECGNKFPVDTAKFCMECGVKRLVV